MENRIILCEGFWYSETENWLPKPIPNKDKWEDQDKFLNNLDIIEKNAHCVFCRGISICRICGKGNGSGEFERKGWKWPDGYRHYIEVHNVKPSKEFFNFVESQK